MASMVATPRTEPVVITVAGPREGCLGLFTALALISAAAAFSALGAIPAAPGVL
jgi:hypothetical protein